MARTYVHFAAFHPALFTFIFAAKQDAQASEVRKASSAAMAVLTETISQGQRNGQIITA
ncbi:WHG domain-containing protein [Scrofimicrobium canadense]|uniref:WHG domain-containing protein n=1 Tax=Scrofimicrobium canadense TaxID=2652290 RepID=UPI00197E202C